MEIKVTFNYRYDNSLNLHSGEKIFDDKGDIENKILRMYPNVSNIKIEEDQLD